MECSSFRVWPLNGLWSGRHGMGPCRYFELHSNCLQPACMFQNLSSSSVPLFNNEPTNQRLSLPLPAPRCQEQASLAAAPLFNGFELMTSLAPTRRICLMHAAEVAEAAARPRFWTASSTVTPQFLSLYVFSLWYQPTKGTFPCQPRAKPFHFW